jgi:rhamnose utilization protein RhaD (predicted bifunctional aldolase and dehydrogenase)
MATPESQGKLKALVELCHELGSPSREWVILGEGNASVVADDETFYIKASGARMGALTDKNLVQISSQPLIEVLESSRDLTELQTAELMKLSIVQETELMPSVEAFVHAYLLSIDGVKSVGHTHVTSINTLVCSVGGWEAVKSGGRLFREEIAVCGSAPCCVPYTEPGIPLARAVRRAVQRYIQHVARPPKTIYLQNHGFIALGRTPEEVIAITSIAEKSAKILLGTFSCGGPHFLTAEDTAKIAARPDENYRQQVLGISPH